MHLITIRTIKIRERDERPRKITKNKKSQVPPRRQVRSPGRVAATTKQNFKIKSPAEISKALMAC